MDFIYQFFRFVGTAWYILRFPSAEAAANMSPKLCLGLNFMSSMLSFESEIFVCSIHLLFFFSKILIVRSREQVARISPNSGRAHLTLQRAPPCIGMGVSSIHFPSLFLPQMRTVLSLLQVAILLPYQSKLISWMMSWFRVAITSTAGLSSGSIQTIITGEEKYVFLRKEGPQQRQRIDIQAGLVHY